MSRIFLTNAATVAAVANGNASAASLACVGPGRDYSIMRWPRDVPDEHGHGRVLSLTPPQALLAAARSDHRLSAMADYEAGLQRAWNPERLAPGVLSYGLRAHSKYDPDAKRWDGELWVRLGEVEDGATLFCACSRAAAAARSCHRVLAAELLARAGWRVVLDGVELL